MKKSLPELPQSKPKKKKREKLPATALPHDCAILCVDAAETSGYAAWERGNLRWYGEVDTLDVDLLGLVLVRFLQLPGPHVVVIERPFMVRFGTQAGIAVGERIWRDRAKRAGFAKRVVRVYPSQWRAVALGKGWGSKKREQTREREAELAPQIVAQHLGPRAPTVGADAAPAIMMGQWASFAGEVLRILPKVRAKKEPKPKRARKTKQLALPLDAPIADKPITPARRKKMDVLVAKVREQYKAAE